MTTILHFEALFLLANVLFFSLTYGFQLRLRHFSSFETKFEKNSELETLRKTLVRAKGRLQQLASVTKDNNSSTSDLKSHVEAGNGEFLVEASIGDVRGMPRKFSWLIMDTGSDLTWTQCRPCNPCYPQDDPIFNPKYSRAFSNLTCGSRLCIVHDICNSTSRLCGFHYGYGDLSYVEGVMAKDTLIFPNGVNFTNFAFGCVRFSSATFPGSGVLAIGRNLPSFISQLSERGEPKMFAYCIPKYSSNKTGYLLTGLSAKSSEDPFAILFPLLSNNVTPYNRNLYYFNITGISVGGERIMGIDEFTFGIKNNGSGGMIIDSGTSFTILFQAAFDLVVKAFMNQSSRMTGGYSKTTRGQDYCITNYSAKELENFPNLVFHGPSKQNLTIPGINNLYTLNNPKLACLAFLNSSDLSIFGNYQQQSLNVLYDLRQGAGMLAFSPKDCGC